MAWQYADFEAPDGDPSAGDATKLARLRLHMAEVEEALGKDMSADGISASHGSLSAKMQRLTARLAELEKDVGLAQTGGRISYQKMNRTS